MSNFVYHASHTRGQANLGWLKSYHTFSFGGYYNEARVHFGALRVLNDDTVDPAMGFDFHPHKNMEIISIPLEGDLLHKDNMGNTALIKSGDIQVMSAGTGVFHSEYNASREQPVKFLQIWVIPDKQNAEPRYQQITLDKNKNLNRFQQIVSPDKDAEGVWIHQQAWFYLGNFDEGSAVTHFLNNTRNGVYVFVLSGDISVNEQLLGTRDGYGIWGTEKLEIKSVSQSRVLLMEVPMAF